MEHLRNLSVYEASPVQFSSFNLQAGTMFSEPAKRFLGKPKVHYMGYNLTVQLASSWQYTMQSHCTTSVQTLLDLPNYVIFGHNYTMHSVYCWYAVLA